MNRQQRAGTALVLGCAVALLARAPAGAADERNLPDGSVAPPGVCAEVDAERLALGPLSPRIVTEGAAGAPRLRFAPGAVAANLPTGMSAPPPSSPGFPGPGPCDSPGSGCLGVVLIPDPVPPASVPTRPGTGTTGGVVVPPPGSTCGGPGFPC